MPNADRQHSWLRISLLSRAMLGTRWEAATWPIVKAELVKALTLKSQIRRAERADNAAAGLIECEQRVVRATRAGLFRTKVSAAIREGNRKSWFSRRRRQLGHGFGVALSLTALLLSRCAADTPAGEFYPLMNSVMARMHGAMQVAPSGDVDRDFARMMLAHHIGAIDMALLELRFGKDERLRRLAQAIIVEQGQEIEVMRSILKPEH